jgi:flagellar basal body-associated protein FliL
MTTEEKPVEKEPAKAPKPSAIGGILRIVLPAIFAAGAAYGGARGAAAHPAAAKHEAPEKAAHHAPGPTVSLDPFLVTLHDANHKTHPMKMTVAIEFDPTSHEDFKPYVPRLRDALLVHVRGLAYEEVIDSAHGEKLRTELLEKCKHVGASGAEKVLITDFVIQ